MGRNTCCCGPANCFRLLCLRIAESKVLDGVILGFIVISCVTLALETPLGDPESEMTDILYFIDLLVTFAYTFEMLVKISAWGFVCAGKDSYIRDPWNIIDFLVVAIYLFGVIGGESVRFHFVRLLRTLRVLHLLKAI